MAKIVYAKAAAAGKRVQALGGAKNHMIVLADADMEAATEALVGSLYGSAGQRCLAGSVIVGVGDAYGEIRERFLDATASLVVGNGLDDGVHMGPVISAPRRVTRPRSGRNWPPTMLNRVPSLLSWRSCTTA